MPCLHKFHSDLNLQNLDFAPETLIVGTFNPQWPEENQAEWFYGREGNNFWEVLPAIYQEATLRGAGVAEWKGFCSRHRIAITDVISCINDADVNNPQHRANLANFTDKNIATRFHDYTFTDIVALLQQHTSIKNVYFTRGATDFWAHRWNPVRDWSNLNGIYNQTLLTPSGYAYYQINRYNARNPDRPVNSVVELIQRRWVEVWHF